MNIFIFSEILDPHAIVVKAALESLSHNVIRFCSNQLPIDAEVCLRLNSQGSGVEICQPPGDTMLDLATAIDLVWLRRPAFPNTASLKIHSADKQAASTENKEFWNAFLPFSFPDAIWINPWQEAKRARSKPLQLRLAAKCGLPIPHTLITNQPGAIKEFISENQQRGTGKTIIKSFYPVKWEMQDGVKLLYATAISLQDLPPDYFIRAVPAIYQNAVSKAYEVRSTFFGNIGHHVKITAQKSGEFLQDWRQGYYEGMQVSPYQMPSEIEEKCRKLMAALGLKFACFDFIVTPEKEYFFLEINEAGQFLWIEKYCPEMPLLSEFCAYILRECGVHHDANFYSSLRLEQVSAWPDVRTALSMEEKQRAAMEV